MNWVLLIVFCVSAVWAPLQSELFGDLLPARARVGMRMIVFRYEILGCRSPACWPGWVASFFLLFGPRLLVRWPGLRCHVSWFLFHCLCGLFALCPGPRGCALNHLIFACAFGRAEFSLPLPWRSSSSFLCLLCMGLAQSRSLVHPWWCALAFVLLLLLPLLRYLLAGGYPTSAPNIVAWGAKAHPANQRGVMSFVAVYFVPAVAPRWLYCTCTYGHVGLGWSSMYYLGSLGCLCGGAVLGLICTLPPSPSSLFFLSLRPSSVVVVWARAWFVCFFVFALACLSGRLFVLSCLSSLFLLVLSVAGRSFLSCCSLSRIFSRVFGWPGLSSVFLLLLVVSLASSPVVWFVAHCLSFSRVPAEVFGWPGVSCLFFHSLPFSLSAPFGASHGAPGVLGEITN